MEFFSIASGSSGNSICIGDDEHHILIDAGISGKRVEAGLNEYDLCGGDIEALFITHEHSDHIQGLGVLARKYGMPIYATAGTIRAILHCTSLGSIDPGLFHPVIPGQDVLIGDLLVHPISISHDAADPVAYITSCREEGREKKIGVVTDLGTYDDRIQAEMQGLSALLLEANHDVNMLQVGPYPYPLKQRILSDIGHLSNERSGQLLSSVLHDHMGPILLGHLSKENNYPDLAYETVRLEVDRSDTPYKKDDFSIDIAPRDRASQRIVV